MLESPVVRRQHAFGARLASLRSAAGLSQAEFAASLGLSLRAYADWERGSREAPLALYRSLLDRYGTDPAWLLTGESSPATAVDDRSFAAVDQISCLLSQCLAASPRPLVQARRSAIVRAAFAIWSERGEVHASDIVRLLNDTPSD